MNKSFSPKISVIISTYCDRALVSKKLNEIRNQSAFALCEFIFIDACSPELEYELLQPFCLEHPNCRVITSAERINLYQAWNTGWRVASAPFLCITNMDDMMHPKLLEEVIDAIEEERWDVLTVLIARQDKGVDWNDWDFKRLCTMELNTRPGAFFAWRKDLDNEIGMFDERLQIVGDKDFWARIRNKGLCVKLIPKLLYLYTKHDQQLSKKQEYREIKQRERELCEHKPYPHRWPAFLQWKIRFYRLFNSRRRYNSA